MHAAPAYNYYIQDIGHIMVGDEEWEAPAEFLCPISQMIMEDPVFTADGQTYERKFIAEWLRPGRMTSPNTNQVLVSARLTPAFSLKAAIETWRRGSDLRTAQEIEQKDILFAVNMKSEDISLKDTRCREENGQLRLEMGRLRDENQALRD